MRYSTNSGILFDIEKLKKERDILEEEASSADFWNDSNKALATIARLNYCKDITNKYFDMLDSVSSLFEMLNFDDQSILEEVETISESLKKSLKDFELEVLFKGEFDNLNAILEIHPGAGGTESCDWAMMLYRMYTRYLSKNGYQYEEIDKESYDKLMGDSNRGDKGFGSSDVKHNG